MSKHSYWIWVKTNKLNLDHGDNGYLPIFKCERCSNLFESYIRYDEPTQHEADYPKYCPNCGAKMDGKPNE